ncbi:MAG: endonuclease III [Desulfuromonadales bacterium]|nr:endonuclease III [Desulfuromonadales bacterium]
MPDLPPPEEVLEVLEKVYPEARIALDFGNPLELLVATILSAQCTDVRVNQVTPELFRRYPDAQAYATADFQELVEVIRSIGFYRAKAKSLIGMGKTLLEEHGGQVPATMEALTRLPGVGRKTANVVLGNAFGVPGMVVDTHVRRVSYRLGWTAQNDPVKIEQELCQLLPRGKWTHASHLLIFHGRQICKAPTPRCSLCPVLSLCPRMGVKKSS